MVKSINEVGQVMGIKTIAEYAASENLINCLKDIGVDHAQGYAVSRPFPLSSMNEDKPKDADAGSSSKNASNIRKLT